MTSSQVNKLSKADVEKLKTQMAKAGIDKGSIVRRTWMAESIMLFKQKKAMAAIKVIENLINELPSAPGPKEYQYLCDFVKSKTKDKAALKWDEIAPSSYTKSNKINNKAALIAASQKRVNLNPLFTFVKQTNEKLKKKEQYNYVQLRQDDYKKEMDEAAALSKRAEELQKKNNNLNITQYLNYQNGTCRKYK